MPADWTCPTPTTCLSVTLLDPVLIGFVCSCLASFTRIVAPHTSPFSETTFISIATIWPTYYDFFLNYEVVSKLSFSPGGVDFQSEICQVPISGCERAVSSLDHAWRVADEKK